MIKNIQLVIAGDDADLARVRSKLLELAGVGEVILEGAIVRVAYDLCDTTCAQVVDQIEGLGLKPVLNVWQRLCLRLRCYREAIHKQELNNDIGWDSFVREIYVSRYRHRRHGRRDDRPRHWRQYSAHPATD
ncbi:MAG: hypothetical protein E2O36_06585 [Proteobacteria bacterium]|nr:MAG: hypothetical protein E2O36_06585 [Pseudomonadota bacterium]